MRRDGNKNPGGFGNHGSEGGSSSPPGFVFTDSYASTCHELGGERLYSTVSTESALEEFLSSNAVEAVRLNEVDEEPEVLLGYDERAVVDRYSGDVHAAVYGTSDFMTFESEEIRYEHELFETPEEKLATEVI